MLRRQHRQLEQMDVWLRSSTSRQNVRCKLFRLLGLAVPIHARMKRVLRRHNVGLWLGGHDGPACSMDWKRGAVVGGEVRRKELELGRMDPTLTSPIRNYRRSQVMYLVSLVLGPLLV
jgi:hypothetical protein